MTLSRSIFRAAVILAAPLVSACGDIEDLRATAETITRTFRLYALSSAPPTYPSAVNTPFGVSAAVDVLANFDVAFDFASGNEIAIHPASRVVTTIGVAHRVALQKVAGTFDAVASAPTGGFVRDSSITVAVGQVVVVEAERVRAGDVCSFALSPNIYSKLVVEAVDRAAGTIDVKLTVNPNCGFRSFEEGIPRN